MIEFFAIIEVFSPLIPIAIYLRKAIRNRWLFILLCYCFVYILLAIYANYIPTTGHSNILRYLIIAIFSFIAFSLLIDAFIAKKTFTLISRILIIVIILFSVVNFRRWEDTSAYNSNSSALASIILIIYCIYYFKLQLVQIKNVFIERQPSFWIVAGIFLYCGANFFVFAFYRPLTLQYKDFAHSVWYFYDIIILLMNIFFAKGITCVKK
ncbi:MAG TPA: hypothetical protein PLA68_17170 [Panacibacter sp.]|nr:hypothetical protein [Panacibacter sp.]